MGCYGLHVVQKTDHEHPAAQNLARQRHDTTIGAKKSVAPVERFFDDETVSDEKTNGLQLEFVAQNRDVSWTKPAAAQPKTHPVASVGS
ncbi:hypothetical protein PAXINDRAFT_21848 [Paxillus involutus ATCC 200175]|uniref:Unplaced genomic scaffold PAXINscaffold_2127, whole genome shotgun sequence n=1 Tax=Paxillus involutus ATCC 200175 TaxID=664439 RepID=A0A0C9T9D3_PAXIN|nr:hypothetical protein PAXINDRAFT_21848 [Paxillus involutus ATCC 200175]